MEIRIIGSKLPLLSATSLAVFTLLALISGELINLSCMGFEVIFPLFAAIAVGEWGKTGADASYDVIAAQSKSLFRWVLMRYLAVWSICSLSALGGMAAVFFIRREMTVGELICIYFPTAFLLSSLAALTSLVSFGEHLATLACGLFWLISLMLRSLLRFPGLAYFYPFIRFAGVEDGMWLANKGLLCLISLGIWGLIYWICNNIPPEK